MASLVDIQTKRAHALGARAVIGRGASCDVCLDDPMIAPAHAEIVRADNGSFELRDLGSSRGTYVGSRKVKSAALTDGDELMIGPLRLRFESDRSSEDPGEELRRLRAIVDLGRAVGVEHDLEIVLERVLDTCLQLLDADRATAVIYEPRSKTPFMTARRTRSGKEMKFGVSTSVLGQVMVDHQPYLRTEVEHDAVLQRSQSLSADGIRSVMAVPLRYEADETEWLGLIQLDSRATDRELGTKELQLLEAIAVPAALAIKNAMLLREVQVVRTEDAELLERVVRDLPVGIVVLREDGVCKMVNPWFTTRQHDLGVVVPGAPVSELAGIPAEQLGATRLLQTRSDRVYSVSSSHSSDDRETVIVIADVTDECARLNQAAHRDRVALVGQLAGGVAHDFNNLLQVIITSAQMLEESIDGQEAREDLSQISHAATSAAALTKQLLTFSRQELVRPRVIDVPQVARGLEKMLRRTLGPQITFTSTITPDTHRVLMDVSQLEQVLMNLVVNARDAARPGADARIELEVSGLPGTSASVSRRPGPHVRIRVADNGQGMSSEIAERVFEPYFTTKTRSKGTGLGLATVHGIVLQAGGDITVESVIGKGTSFEILLPCCEADATESRAVTSDRERCRKGTVLVVDDDEAVQGVTARILRSAGYSVLLANSGANAMEIVSTHPTRIDVLLTDLVMPGMTGRDLANNLLSQKLVDCVVYMSGYHHHAPLGADQFVAKPFTRDELLEKMRDTQSTEAWIEPAQGASSRETSPRRSPRPDG